MIYITLQICGVIVIAILTLTFVIGIIAAFTRWLQDEYLLREPRPAQPDSYSLHELNNRYK